MLATQSTEARAQQERCRQACTIRLSINEDTKLEKGERVFIDSQAAIKRLQLSSLTGGQELVFKITQSCSYLASKNISINFYWVPSHLGIYGNEIVDKLAKKGLSRRKIHSSYSSLAYLGKRAREKILEQWKNN